jgi:protein-S-isoprenylcysteine O-methyltransferase Ste14
MEAYSRPKTGNAAQVFLVLVQLIWIGLAIAFLVNHWFPSSGANPKALRVATITILVFNLLTFGRFFGTLFVFINRRISTEEMVSVPIAFGIYYFGFLYLMYLGGKPSTASIVAGSVLFLIGSTINSLCEYQRKQWKKDPDHRGKLYRSGLFSISRHPNYFGDVLWVLGYVVVTGNLWCLIVPAVLLLFFWKVNIPVQEKYLAEKYGDQMKEYCSKTKSLVPFVL